MNNLRKLRKGKELSLKQLGNYLGMSESTISLYENNKREPDIATLFKLADYFDVSVDYLLDRESKKEASLPVTMLEKDAQKLLDMYDEMSKESKDQVMRYVTSLSYVDRANKSAQSRGALGAYEGGTQQHTVSKEAAEKVLRRLDDMEKNT